VAGNVKGLTVELGGETRGLDDALSGLGKSANTINKELGQVERGLKFDPSNTVLLAQKQGLLADKIEATRDRLDALKQAQDRVDAMYASGEIDDGQYRAFQRDLETTKSKLGTFEGQLKGVEGQQKQTGTAAKNMGDDVDKAGDKAKSGGKKLELSFSNIAGAVGGAVAAMGLLSIVGDVLENADALQVMSDATGLSAERLQELQYIGKDVGVELDTIAGAQAKLSKAMFAARKGTAAQSDAFKTLGVSVVDHNGKLRDAKVVMGEAFDALSKMSNPTERDATAMVLFGKSAQDLNPLLKLGADGMAAMSEKARESGAVMSNEAVAGLDAFGDTLDQLKQGGMAIFGEWFAGVLPDIQAFLNMFNGGGGLDLSTLIPPEIMAQLDTLSASLTTLGETVMPGVKAWYTENIGPTMTEIGAAFEAVAMEVIPTITSIVDFVSDNWPMIQRAIEPVMTAIIGVIRGALLIVSGIISTVMAVIRGDWGAAWEGIKTALQGVWDIIKALLVGVWDVIKALFTLWWNGLVASATMWMGLLWGVIKGVWATITNGISTAIDFIKAFIVAWWNGLVATATAGMDFIWAVIKTVWATITNGISTAIDFIKAFIVAWWNGLVATATAGMDFIWAVIKGVWATITTGISTAIEFIMLVFTGQWGKLGAIAEGAWNAVMSAVSGVWSGIKSAVSTAASYVVSSFSTGWAGLGGIASGAWNAVKSAVSGAWDGIKSGVSSGINTVVGFVGGLHGKLVGVLSGAISWLSNIGRSIIDGLLNGLKAAWKGVTDWLSGRAAVIRALKGPIDYDRTILKPAGLAIMAGFRDALDTGFGEVRAALSGYGPAIGDMSFAGVGAGYGPASPSSIRTSSVGDTIHIGNITIDGSTMPSADFNGLIASIQMAKRMGG